MRSGKKTDDQKDTISDFVKGNVFPVLIISYELVQKHYESLLSIPEVLIVCDEGHRLKNSSGNKTIHALASLRSRKRILLTGTPGTLVFLTS